MHNWRWLYVDWTVFFFALLFIHVDAAIKTWEHQSGRFWVTCHTFTLALWTQSFAGGVDASAVDADVAGNGAAESSASSMVPPAEDQSAWLSKSCQTWSDTFGHRQTLSDIFRPCQPSCGHNPSWHGIVMYCDVLWWMFCKHWGVFALALGAFFFKGWPRDNAIVLYASSFSLVKPCRATELSMIFCKLVWLKVRWVCRRRIWHLWLRKFHRHQHWRQALSQSPVWILLWVL